MFDCREKSEILFSAKILPNIFWNIIQSISMKNMEYLCSKERKFGKESISDEAM